MRTIAISGVLVVAGTALWGLSSVHGTTEVAADGDQRVVIRDDCDPTDERWTPTGGCALEEGDVDLDEFNALRFTPLSTSSPAPIIGHQAWRNDPSYLKVAPGETVKVANRGGRTHTFTEVAAFGGGRVPPLNQGFMPAPECASATDLPAGAKTSLTLTSEGNHHFQCCIHPWMRATIKVKAETEDEDLEN